MTVQELPAASTMSDVHPKEGTQKNSLQDALRRIPILMALVATLAISTGALYFRHFHDFYAPDSPSYLVSAARLAAGHGFTDADGNPETVRTPGYPLLIAIFLRSGVDLKYLILLQHLVRVLIISATATFVFFITSSRIQAWVAGLLLCLDLPVLEVTNSFLTEIMFTTVLMIVFWLLWTESSTLERWSALITSGLLAGASALIRPVALFFFVPAAIYLLLVRGRFRWRAVGTFSLAFLCFPALWAARNYLETGSFTFSSIAGVNMLLYRAAGALAIKDPGNFEANLMRRQDQLQEQACEGLEKLWGRPCGQISMTQKSEYYEPLGRKILLQHPADYLKLSLRGAGLMMLGGDATRLSAMTGLAPEKSRKALLLFTLPLFCLGVLGLWRLWSQNRPLFVLTALMICYFVGISVGAEVYSRMRVPIEPLCVIAIAGGVEFAWNRVLRRSR